MKKTLFLFVVVLLFLSRVGFAQIRSASDLIGIWSGNQLRVAFIDRSKIEIVFPGGTKQSGTYVADFFHTPVVLQMSFNNGNDKVEFKCLVESIQPNMLKWELFEKSVEPKSFTKSFYTLALVRN